MPKPLENPTNTNGGINKCVCWQSKFLLAGDKFHGTDETGAVARRKQLLWIHTTTGTTHFLGQYPA